MVNLRQLLTGLANSTAGTLEQKQVETLLKLVVLAIFAGSVISSLALAAFSVDQNWRYAGPVVLCCIGLMAWVLIRQGKVMTASKLLAAGLWLSITAIMFTTGGVRAPVVIAYPLIILMSGWVLGAGAARVLAALTVLSTLACLLADLTGHLPQNSHSTAGMFVTDQIAVYFLSAALVAAILRAYSKKLQESHDLSYELAEYNNLLEKSSAQLERAQSVANVGSWFGDIATNQITPSPQGCRILGMTLGASSSYQAYMAQVHEDDRARVAQDWQTALKSGIFDDEHRVIVNAAVRWVRQRAELTFAPDGSPVNVLGIVQDITRQKETELALKASEERYRTLIDWTPDAVLVHQRTRILYANPAALALFGAPNMPSLLSKRTTDLIHPDDLSQQQARMRSIEQGEAQPHSTEARFLKLDGSTVEVEVQGTAIEFDGEPAVHVSIRDITQRKRLENDIRQLAFYDSLTNLPNRRLLDDRLRQVMSANQRNRQFGALMFLDLDNFKPLNDQHGHAVGDLLLVQAAQRLTLCTRAMDTVARFGGDEFVVLLTELDTDRDKARQFAETVALKIKAAMAAPYSFTVEDANLAQQQIEHRCTASMGVVVFDSSQARASEITRWADAAMYQAKNDGRNRICFAEHSANNAVNHYFFDSSQPLSDKG